MLNGDEEFDLGLTYRDGKGVTQDLKKALYWYEKAAEMGHARAQSNLGQMYGNGEGVAQDDKTKI